MIKSSVTALTEYKVLRDFVNKKKTSKKGLLFVFKTLCVFVVGLVIFEEKVSRMVRK